MFINFLTCNQLCKRRNVVYINFDSLGPFFIISLNHTVTNVNLNIRIALIRANKYSHIFPIIHFVATRLLY